MTKRINVILPETTVRSIDRLVRPGERSRFIDRAVQHYVATQSAEAARARLEQAAVRDRDLDEATARDWSAVDHEPWQQLDQTEAAPRTPVTSNAVKSTSRRSTRR